MNDRASSVAGRKVWRLWRAQPDGGWTGLVTEDEDGGLKELCEAGGDGLSVVVLADPDEDPEWLEGLDDMGLEGLLLDEAAAQALPAPFRSERLGFLPGVDRGDEAFCAYKLIARRADRQTAPELAAPVRGRLWRSLIEELDEGGRVFLAVGGPAGSGKSYLLGALAGHLARRGVRVARAGCLPSDAPGALVPWRTVLIELAGDRAEAMLIETGRRLGLGDAVAAEATGFLIRGEGDGRLGPDQYRDLLPRLTAGTLRQLAGEREMACVIDDRQWLDDVGREVLEQLRETPGGLRLLVGRRGNPTADEVALDPMSESEHADFLVECGGGNGVTAGLNREIFRISGGLPLVAREMLALLRVRGGLVFAGGMADLAPGAAVDSLGLEAGTSVGLGDRLQALPAALRQLLAACAILREPFSRRQAQWMVEKSGCDLDFERAWRSPALGEFLIPAAFEGSFSFTHDLLREAAKAVADEQQRRAGHAAALEWLGERGQIESKLGEAAYHAREAGRQAEAVELYDRAAAAALRRFALREAREAAREAAALEGRGDERVSERRGIRCQIEGEAAFHAGALDEAIGLLERALVLFGVMREPGKIELPAGAPLRQVALLARGGTGRTGAGSERELVAARAALMLGEIAYFQDERHRSALYCLLALDLAARVGDSGFLASLCAAVACPLSGRRPRWIADRYLEIGRTMGRRQADPAQLPYVMHVGNLTDLARGRWDETRAGGLEGVAHWRSQGHGRRAEESWVQLFYAAYLQGRIAEAGEAAAALKASACQRTNRQTRLWAALLCGLHGLRASDPGDAFAACRQEDEEGADVMTRHAVQVVRAVAEWRQGKPWQALEYLQKADALAREEPPVSPVQIQLVEAALLCGEMKRRGPPELGRDREFQALMARSLRIAASFAKAFTFGRPLAVAAAALCTENGASSLRRAAGMAEALGMPVERGRIECLGGGDFQAGLRRLEEHGAGGEARHFRQLIPANEGGRT